MSGTRPKWCTFGRPRVGYRPRSAVFFSRTQANRYDIIRSKLLKNTAKPCLRKHTLQHLALPTLNDLQHEYEKDSLVCVRAELDGSDIGAVYVERGGQSGPEQMLYHAQIN